MKKKLEYIPLTGIYGRVLFETLHNSEMFSDLQRSDKSLSPFIFDKSVVCSYLINNHFCTIEEFTKNFKLNEKDIKNRGKYVHLSDIMLFQRNMEIEDKYDIPEDLADFIGRDLTICMGWFDNNDFPIDNDTIKTLLKNIAAYSNLRFVEKSEDDDTIITKFEC